MQKNLKMFHFPSIPKVPCESSKTHWEGVCLHLNERYWEHLGCSVLRCYSKTCIPRLMISMWKPTKLVIQESQNAPAVASQICQRAAELIPGRVSNTLGGGWRQGHETWFFRLEKKCDTLKKIHTNAVSDVHSRDAFVEKFHSFEIHGSMVRLVGHTSSPLFWNLWL